MSHNDEPESLHRNLISSGFLAEASISSCGYRLIDSERNKNPNKCLKYETLNLVAVNWTIKQKYLIKPNKGVRVWKQFFVLYRNKWQLMASCKGRKINPW